MNANDVINRIATFVRKEFGVNTCVTIGKTQRYLTDFANVLAKDITAYRSENRWWWFQRWLSRWKTLLLPMGLLLFLSALVVGLCYGASVQSAPLLLRWYLGLVIVSMVGGRIIVRFARIALTLLLRNRDDNFLDAHPDVPYWLTGPMTGLFEGSLFLCVAFNLGGAAAAMIYVDAHQEHGIVVSFYSGRRVMDRKGS